MRGLCQCHRRLLILCLCLLSGLGFAKSPNITISGVQGTLVKNIKERLTELEKLEDLNRISITLISAQIEQAMYPYGYFKPHIDVERQHQMLKIRIIAGTPLRIRHIHRTIAGEGRDNRALQQAFHDFPIHAGQILNTVDYEKAKQDLLLIAEQEGYMHAHFKTAQIQINRQAYWADITINFHTGPRYYFGDTRFLKGYLNHSLLYRYLPYAKDEPFSPQKILELDSRLGASGYYSSVIVRPRFAKGSNRVRVDVDTKRNKRLHYSLGAGYGTDTGIRGRAGLSIVPVNRSGDKFNALALGSTVQNTLQGQYIIPGFRPDVDNYLLTANLSNFNYDAGYANAFLLTAATRHDTKSHQRIFSLNGLYERYNYDLSSPRFEKLIFFPKATLAWQKRSSELFSPNGWNVTVNGLGADKSALSETTFAQYSLDFRAAITLAPVRTRFYVHAISGQTAINDVTQLPLSLALLLGGADNLKAYSFNSIGPGKSLRFASMELQKETFEKWFLIGFSDIGSVYQPTPRNWLRDVGVGLMWVSPVGPIKIAVALPVDEHYNRIPGQNPRLVVNMGPDL